MVWVRPGAVGAALVLATGAGVGLALSAAAGAGELAGRILDAAIIPRRCPGLRLALADAQQPLRQRHHGQVRRHGRKIYMSFVTVLRKGAETRVIWRQRFTAAREATADATSTRTPSIKYWQ